MDRKHATVDHETLVLYIVGLFSFGHFIYFGFYNLPNGLKLVDQSWVEGGA